MSFSLARPALFALALAGPLFSEGPFHDLSFDDALAEAGKDERVVFIDFYTTWCPPCKQLDQVTWKDEKVVAWLEANTVAIKVDAEAQVELAQRFAIGAYPTLVFVDGAGEELGRLVGYKGPEEFLAVAPGTMRGEKESERVRRGLVEKPHDFSLRMSLGDALVREGQFEEALAEYLWCFDKGLEYEPSYYGVRLSFLLGDIVELGKRYPPAHEALRQRVSEARARLLSGSGSPEDAHDLASICGALGEQAVVLELWDSLVEKGALSDRIRMFVFDEVVDLLLDAGRYTDILESIGDVMAELRGKIEQQEEFEQQAVEFGIDDAALEHMVRTKLVEWAKTYQALLGAKDERAPAYSAAVLEFNRTALAFAQLARAATKVEAYETAREHLKQGYAIANKAGERLLRSAERRLPKQERLPREKK